MPSREDQFCVYLYDRVVGRLHRCEDVTRFVFEESYWEDPSRAVLGLRFEEDRKARHRSNLRLPPWFSNLLPEGRLREWIAQARHTPIQREMELLAQVGHDLPGAVRVLAADAPIPVDISGGEPEIPANSLSSPLWRFSLAGVALKFSLLAQGDRLAIPAFGEGGDWIVKLPDPHYPEVPRNEFAMMTLAKAVGIDVPEIRLVHRDQVDPLPNRVWPNGEEWAYAIERFDRGANREPIHIEDLAQVRGFYPEDKYNGSFETVAALIHRGRDIPALQEFARRMAFNVLIGNGDAHLKNWSLIYRDRHTPALAPAYDLVATFVYHPAIEGAEDMALRFGHSRRFADVSIANFEWLERKLGVEAGLGDIVFDLVGRVSSEWPGAAEVLANHTDLAERIGGFIRERVDDFAKAKETLI